MRYEPSCPRFAREDDQPRPETEANNERPVPALMPPISVFVELPKQRAKALRIEVEFKREQPLAAIELPVREAIWHRVASDKPRSSRSPIQETKQPSPL